MILEILRSLVYLQKSQSKQRNIVVRGAEMRRKSNTQSPIEKGRERRREPRREKGAPKENRIFNRGEPFVGATPFGRSRIDSAFRLSRDDASSSSFSMYDRVHSRPAKLIHPFSVALQPPWSHEQRSKSRQVREPLLLFYLGLSDGLTCAFSFNARAHAILQYLPASTGFYCLCPRELCWFRYFDKTCVFFSLDPLL